MNEGDVVILNNTGQAGTLTEFLTSETVQVILRSLEIWHGPVSSCRLPQSREELDAAPLEVERPVHKRRKKP